MPVAGFGDGGDLVVEGKVVVEEDTKVACSVGGVNDCVGVDVKCRIVKFGKLGWIAKDEEFSL